MKKLLVATAVLTFVMSASAAGTVSGTETWGLNVAEPVNGTGGGVGMLPDAGTAYYNFRILITLDAGDDWTVCTTDITLTNATFYQKGVQNPPDPNVFVTNPDKEYDSYFASPQSWPNSTSGGTPSFAAGPIWTATTVTCDWMDTAVGGDGDQYLASLTIIPDSGHETDWTGTVSGEYTTVSGGGNASPFSFDLPIPEPASLALLALGSLALIRRR